MDVYIVGSFSTNFRKSPEKSYRDLVSEVYTGVLADAESVGAQEIGFCYFGSTTLPGAGQPSIGGQVCFLPLVRKNLFPERIPIVNVEGACATGSLAFQCAWKEIKSGQAQVALAVSLDKLYNPDNPAAVLKSMTAGMDNFTMDDTLDEYRRSGEMIGAPFSEEGYGSLMMRTYAMQAGYHMWKYGTTREQIAVAAAKNHNYGVLNPKALYRFEMTPEQVLADREVSYPLSRAMCAPIADGAAAALLCSDAHLRTLPQKARDRAVRIRACELSGGKFRSFDEPGLSCVAAHKAFRSAGVSPPDIDVAEVHDATAFCEIYQAEMLGFCDIGAGGPFVADGATGPGGQIPINTSGGLISKGHPIAATGLSMIYELTTQLRGDAGPRQVPEARLALQQNGGGVIGFEEAVCSVIILERES